MLNFKLKDFAFHLFHVLKLDSLVQQLLRLTGSGGMSSSPESNSSIPVSPATPLALPSDVSSLIGLLFSFTALRDWLKLIVIGSFLETCRRFVFSIWRTTIDSFFITAQFKEEDSSYDWMMVWLSKQPAWRTYHLNVTIYTNTASNTFKRPFILLF